MRELQGGGVKLEQAQAFMTEQAQTYARRVNRGEINASAVEGLLRADADYAADAPEMRRTLFRMGVWEFAKLAKPRRSPNGSTS
jgi:hypothetical protein